MLAHLKANDYAHMRHMWLRLPPAKKTTENRVVHQSVDPGMVAASVLQELSDIQQKAQLMRWKADAPDR